MLAQRPGGSAPAVRAVAERLPFPDGAFDAAMGVLTMHHWADRDRGLAEMHRVAGRVVLFLRDPRRRPFWWLDHYFPATARLEAARETRVAELERVLGPLEVIPVPIPGDCADGFNGAYWRRPRAILDPAVPGADAGRGADPRRTAPRESAACALTSTVAPGSGAGATCTGWPSLTSATAWW